MCSSTNVNYDRRFRDVYRCRSSGVDEQEEGDWVITTPDLWPLVDIGDTKRGFQIVLPEP